jgi:cytochrome c oxidase subunit II
MINTPLRSMIFPVIVFALLFTAGNLFAAETKTYQITAQSYEFLPDTIRVNQGDKVILNITAIDKDHGFGIKAMDINQRLPKGKTVTIEFVAEKKGEFKINCTQFCGFGHFGMKAKLIVS